MRVKRIGIIVIGLLALAAIAVHPSDTPPLDTGAAHARSRTQNAGCRQRFGYEIVGEYPHDTEAYTQGLIYIDGFLYESTGITGRSSLRKVRLETGEIIQQRAVNPADFAEGLTE